MRRLAGARVAATAALIGAMLLGLASVRALRVDPTGALTEPSDIAAVVSLTPVRSGAPDAEALLRATERNPFHPERRRGGRFRLPGHDPGDAIDPTAAPVPNGPVSLVGTAVTGGGRDFVLCRVGHDTPRLVRRGERCGDLVLRAVEQGRATFMDPAGERVVLEVPKAGAN